MRRRTAILLGAAVVAAPVRAQDAAYPSRPIRLIVPFPPGGGTDLMGRLVAEGLAAALGVSVVVDNRGGAGGLIGTEAAAQAAPDGHTLLLGSVSTISINPNLQARPGLDPLRDLAPVALFAATPSAVVVPAGLPAATLAELIALARARPGALNFASAGNGTSHHLGGEMLSQMAGIRIVHVPYRGSAPALAGLLGGDAQIMIAPIAAVLPMVEAGRLRALAVTGAARSALLPAVPTVAESGLPSYEMTLWYGVFAPARAPEAIIARLNAAMARTAASPEVRDRLAAEGASAEHGTPRALGELAERDARRWREVIRNLPPL